MNQKNTEWKQGVYVPMKLLQGTYSPTLFPHPVPKQHVLNNPESAASVSRYVTPLQTDATYFFHQIFPFPLSAHDGKLPPKPKKDLPRNSTVPIYKTYICPSSFSSSSLSSLLGQTPAAHARVYNPKQIKPNFLRRRPVFI